MTTTTKVLIGSAAVAAGAYLLLRQPVAPQPVPVVVAEQKAAPAQKATKPAMSDAEMFEMLFGKGSDKFTAARKAVDEQRARHPGKSMRELALDPALIGRMATLMATMSKNPDEFKGLAEAAHFAMQMKGLKPGPQTGVNLNLNDILSTDSEAERYLGAVLTDDARALSDLFSDIVNEAAVEMAIDPARNAASSGVSVKQGPLPQGTTFVEDANRKPESSDRD